MSPAPMLAIISELISEWQWGYNYTIGRNRDPICRVEAKAIIIIPTIFQKLIPQKFVNFVLFSRKCWLPQRKIGLISPTIFSMFNYPL